VTPNVRSKSRRNNATFSGNGPLRKMHLLMTLHIIFRSFIATSTLFCSDHNPREEAALTAPTVSLRAMLRKSVDSKPVWSTLPLWF